MVLVNTAQNFISIKVWYLIFDSSLCWSAMESVKFAYYSISQFNFFTEPFTLEKCKTRMKLQIRSQIIIIIIIIIKMMMIKQRRQINIILSCAYFEIQVTFDVYKNEFLMHDHFIYFITETNWKYLNEWNTTSSSVALQSNADLLRLLNSPLPVHSIFLPFFPVVMNETQSNKNKKLCKWIWS
jgi:hypothetical protein